MDEWIYFLKNSEVKGEFKAKGLAEAKEVLDIMRLDKEQQYGYNRYLDYLHLKASEALSLRLEAEERVRKDEKIEIAKNAILEGVDSKIIAKITGLPIEEIEALRAQLKK